MSLKELPESLRNSREFRRVYERGRRYTTTYFSAFILRTDLSKPRFGLTVTRKIGNAVIRNRCKRRLRQIVSGFFKDLRSAAVPVESFDLVLNVRSALPGADFKEVDEAFRTMMERLLRVKSAGEGKPGKDADGVD